MQPHDVLMPPLGETVASGTILRWLKASGETVAADEPLFEVETEKVSMEIQAPVSGVLGAILVPEGVTVDVGVKVAEIILPAGTQRETETQSAPATAQKPVVAADEQPRTTAAGREQLSPAVRKLLQEHKISAAEVQGTGTGRRITKGDVLEYIARRGGAHGAANDHPQDELVPFTPIRKRIAEHMVRSKATSPHVLQAVEVDFTAVTQARSEVGAQWKQQHGFSLTYLPFVAWAVSRALQEFPRANATVEGEALRLHRAVNLCIAVDIEGEGLLTPVISNAERASVPDLARSIQDLATRARSNTLKPQELTRGTYTISNSGVFGTLLTAPVINQPQVAILSIDAVIRKPTVTQQQGREVVDIRPIGVLAQSFDHRAFDGAYSAAFLARVRRLIEHTDWVQEMSNG